MVPFLMRGHICVAISVVCLARIHGRKIILSRCSGVAFFGDALNKCMSNLVTQAKLGIL